MAAFCPGVLSQTAAGTQPALPQNICGGHSGRPCAVPHAACVAVSCCRAAQLNLNSARLLPANLVLIACELLVQARAAGAKAKGDKVSKARKERTKEAKEVSVPATLMSEPLSADWATPHSPPPGNSCLACCTQLRSSPSGIWGTLVVAWQKRCWEPNPSPPHSSVFPSVIGLFIQQYLRVSCRIAHSRCPAAELQGLLQPAPPGQRLCGRGLRGVQRLAGPDRVGLKPALTVNSFRMCLPIRLYVAVDLKVIAAGM